MSTPSAHSRSVNDRADVVVVGAGSSGLVTALELAHRGVSVRLVERAPEPHAQSRGTGLQPRTLELLDLHGVAEQLVAKAHPVRALTIFRAGERIAEVDFTLSPSPFDSVTLPQAQTEGVLRQRLADAGVDVEWATELVALSQDEDGVKVALRRADGLVEVAYADWLVGADGAGSAVRELMGLSFSGLSYLERWGLIDGELDWELAPDAVRIFQDAERRGQVVVVPLGGTRYRVQSDQLDPLGGALPSVEEMQQLLDRFTGVPSRLADPQWQATFRVHRRQVVTYRTGRALLVGDAAHIHTPAGAQGLNTGIADAINLGWKLAHVITGQAEPALLDSYEQERHPIAEGVLGLTESLAREPERIGTLDPALAQGVAAVVTQCALSYRHGPLGSSVVSGSTGLRAGDRLPDLAAGPHRLYERLRHRRVVMALLGDGWEPRLDRDLPGVDVWRVQQGARSPLAEAVGFSQGVVIIRPDGYLGLLVEGEPGVGLEAAQTYLNDVLHLTRETADV